MSLYPAVNLDTLALVVPRTFFNFFKSAISNPARRGLLNAEFGHTRLSQDLKVYKD